MSKTVKWLLSGMSALLMVASCVCLLFVFPSSSDNAPATDKPSLPTEKTAGMPSSTVIYGKAPADPWADCPDGIRIATVPGKNYLAHVMYVRDPSAVYLATSGNSFSLEKEGTRLLNQLRAEGAVAGINAGAFNDDGSAGTHVGSVPIGLVVSEGRVLWDDGKNYHGFVGMTTDNKLYVADTVDRDQLQTLGIRDGCCFGPVLVKDGVVNHKITESSSYRVDRNSRTAIGQLGDGTVFFVCIDGRQAGSLGADYSELQSLVVDLGAVNACTLDGGASTVMAYRDDYGRYGKAGNIVMVSSYSLFQASPRRMPTFFMVRDSKEDR